MTLKIGEINHLTVVRKTDIAFVLKNENAEEVFLHVNESDNQALEPDMVVETFLYLDNRGRVAGTLKKPLITMGNPGFLEVVAINKDLGVFLDLGISKDVLFSKDDLPLNENLWPKVGDKLYVELRIKSKMLAKPVNFEELPKNEDEFKLNDEAQGHVQILGQIGIFVITDTLNTVLIRNSQLRKKYRLGEPIDFKITYHSPIGYEGSLIANKEVIRYDDAEMILEYLKNHQNKMPYTSDTDAETIQEVFNLSRKAFKRALGHLYKERLVEFIENETILKD